MSVLQSPLFLIGLSSLSFGSILYLSYRMRSRENALPSKRAEKIVAIAKPYSRKVVFTAALAWAVFLYISAARSYEEVEPAVSFLTRMYGLSALAAIYAVLSLGIVRVYFPRFPLNPLLLHSSRGFGLSVFLFAVLHASSAYIANLDGKLSAVMFLSTRHQVALALSTLAFLILLSMAATSMDRVINWMTFPRWKKLHRLVYVATIAVLFHAFLIGSHFVETGTLIPFLVMYGALTLLMLEAGAIYLKLQQNGKNQSELSVRFAHAGLVLMVCAGMFLATTALQNPVDPHAGHRMSDGSDYAYSTDYLIKGLEVSPQAFTAGQTTNLRFQVVKKGAEQQPWKQFYMMHDKPMHLIVVSDDLNEFQHLHPVMDQDGMISVDFTPATSRAYYLYVEFVPEPKVEALITAKITGSVNSELPAMLVPSNAVAQVDNFSVSLQLQRPIVAQRDFEINFQVFDTASGQPAEGLERYLGEFGHLAIVSEDKQDYVHVHPMPEASSDSGGKISFMTWFPRSGSYRLYLQFQHEGEVKSVQYTLEVAK